MNRAKGKLGLVLIHKGIFSYRNIANFSETSSSKVGKFQKSEISKVLSGKRNTKRYIELLESIFGLPIATIRQWYEEDKGYKMSRKEREDFLISQRNKE